MSRALTTAQLGTLRRRLERERARIRRVLEAAEAAAPGEPQAEVEEAAQRAAEQEQQMGISARERALLAEVERALAKLERGTYGLSEKTGEPIPYRRLAAVPWARQGVDE